MALPLSSLPIDPTLRDAHTTALEAITTRVRSLHASKTPFRIYHGSTNSTRQSTHTRHNIVDTSSLDKVLLVDEDEHTALVEPNVSMEKLVGETLRKGLVPPVVMEFPGITAGGGFSGTSAESSSFQHGVFDRNVRRIELVLADGTPMTASPTLNADMFHGAASSFGTLGVTTLLELDLVPAKAYVRLDYHVLKSMKEAEERMREHAQDGTTQYLDGIVFAADRIVVMSGSMTDATPPNARIIRFTRPSDPWFYLQARSKLSPDPKAQSPQTDYIPLADYLFRYNRGAFWTGRYSFAYFLTPFTALTRRLLDPFMRTKTMYHALHKSGLADQYIVQDVAVPFDESSTFLAWLDRHFAIYPLWLCPLRRRGGSGGGSVIFHPDVTGPDPLFMNFGVWGPGPTRRRDFVAANRRLEAKVRELGGQKCLYAQAFYTPAEFWSIYDEPRYQRLREKSRATHLPSIVDKVCVDWVGEAERDKKAGWGEWGRRLFWGIWPMRGVYGVAHVVFRREYLIRRRRGLLGRAVARLLGAEKED